MLGFSAIFIIGIYYLPDILPTRVNSTVIALNHAIEKTSFTTFDFKEMDRFVQPIFQEGGRRQIWIDVMGNGPQDVGLAWGRDRFFIFKNWDMLTRRIILFTVF